MTDPPFAIAAKFRYYLYEQIAFFLRRNMPAILEDHKSRIEDRIMEFMSVVDRDHFVILTPHDQRRLSDKMCVIFDTFRVPGPRGRQQ